MNFMNPHGPVSQFTPQIGYYHQCDHRCQVVHEFGNVYRCVSSNMQHICDANCDQRIQLDRYSTICKLSKKVAPLVADTMAIEADDRARKRRTDSPRACSSRKSLKSDQQMWNLQQSDDTMVM